MVYDLLRGHEHFHREYVAQERSFLNRLAGEKQNPDALFIGCSDSRVVPELLTTSSPGELFVVRNIANLIPPYAHPHASVGAALEYAVGHLHVPHVVVCGHDGCGGVRALLDGEAALEHSPSLKLWLELARPAVASTREHAGDVDVWWRRAVEANVLEQLVNVATYPVVTDALERGELELHGWVYDLFSLDLRVYDVDADAFVRAAEVITAPPEGTRMSQARTHLDKEALDRLRSGFRGALVEPGDALYDGARAVWNARVDRRPALIARCTGVADVLAAVGFAREQGALVAVRGGGHDVAGNGVCDGGVVIDLSPMKGVRVHPGRRTVRAQAGLTWAELDRETQAFGLATTGGQCSSTGVAGVALGGGIGWLMRQHGLTIDNLISADLVTADGRFVTASEHENAELFWGLRGGGGNFGVVTELELRVHPVRDVAVAMLFHPFERLADALRFYMDFTDAEPDPLATALIAMELPAMPQVPAPMHHALGVMIVAAFNGPLERAEPILAPLRAFGPPVAEIVAAMPYLALQSMFNGSPAGDYGYGQSIRSNYFPKLGDEAIEAVVAQMRAPVSPLCLFEIAHLGGAIARVGEDDTAFPRRATPFFSMFQASFADPADAARHVRWTDAAWQALAPFSSGGTHVGFIDGDEAGDRVREAYGDAKMQRLAALKRAWDPTNFFRMNKNIKP